MNVSVNLRVNKTKVHSNDQSMKSHAKLAQLMYLIFSNFWSGCLLLLILASQCCIQHPQQMFNVESIEILHCPSAVQPCLLNPRPINQWSHLKCIRLLLTTKHNSELHWIRPIVYSQLNPSTSVQLIYTTTTNTYCHLIGHSNYQIKLNRRYPLSNLDTLPTVTWLHHCIRSTFSLYWIIWILNIQVQNWLNIATHTYDNRNVLNKGDDEVRWWLSMGGSKVIIIVPIWKCVGLTPIWSNFPDVHHFHTHILENYLLNVLLIQLSPSHRGTDSDSTNWNQIRPYLIFLTRSSICTL